MSSNSCSKFCMKIPEWFVGHAICTLKIGVTKTAINFVNWAPNTPFCDPTSTRGNRRLFLVQYLGGRERNGLNNYCRNVINHFRLDPDFERVERVTNKNNFIRVRGTYMWQTKIILSEFEVRMIFGGQKYYACERTIILGGEDRRQSTNYVLSGY